MSELPELTAEERAAMDSVDMTEILGTWEERYGVAMRTAKRLLHENNDLRQRLAEAEALLREACEGMDLEKWDAWEQRAKEVTVRECLAGGGGG
jgi:hypothetical protein